MSLVKTIFSDIDGTLLDKNRQLSQKTIQVIKSLPKEISVILASSRMPKAMRHLQAELSIEHRPLVCYNGAYILSSGLEDAEVLFSTGIDPVTCRSIVDLAEVGDIHVSLYSGEDWYVPSRDKWAEREERNTKITPLVEDPLSVLDQWTEDNRVVHKIMCMGGENEIGKLHAFLEKEMSKQVHSYRSKETYIEVAPIATSKAHAIKVLHKLLGIDPKTIMAFGDNYNDIEMLSAVEIGIAVDNAKPEVKLAASHITKANIDDGVALAIEQHLLAL